MATPDSNLSTLEKIRTKARRITRNPSEAQLATSEIDNYINTFVLYGMPAHMKLGSLEGVFRFFTHPGVDVYETNATDVSDPMYNFKNLYTNVKDPVYIEGSRSKLCQTREEFYSIYPQEVKKIIIGTGDGIITDFTYNTGAGIIKNSIVISTVSSTTHEPVVVTDNGEGELVGDVNPLSSVSYPTGQVYVSFSVPPEAGSSVWMATEKYIGSKPITILFFEDAFTVRPVPNNTYKIEVNVDKRPSSFLSSSDTPDLSEWWEYIAIGAGIKILQDRLDSDGVNLLLPMFKEQEILIGRRKIIQLAGQRTPTIFSGGR